MTKYSPAKTGKTVSTFLSRYMLPRLRFRATFSQSFFNRKLYFKSLNKWGGAVAVEATVGTLVKHVFNTDSPEKSPLKSSPLKEKKKPWAANLQVQTCAMIPAKNIFCLIVRIFLFSSILLLWCSCKSMAWKQCMTFRQAVYMSMMNDKYSSE